MSNKLVIGIFLLLLTLACDVVRIVPGEPTLPTEIVEESNNATSTASVVATEVPQATATPTIVPTLTLTPTATITPFPLQALSLAPPGAENCNNDETCRREPPRHGLIIAFILPILVLGIPWLIAEFFVVKYVQPKSIDLSEVLIKAGDGLFVGAVISLTARRMLRLASTRMTWSRVAEFVEKSLEQELLHQALSYPTLEDLEKNLKNIAENFINLPVVTELAEDFGVQVMRFNIETQYPQETMDALNRKAEAAAGGTAYLAYAAAAQLNPNSRESRELYRVYQETRGQVDAARNLGGGLTHLAGLVGGSKRSREETDDDTDV
ncbi:MAG: hypothetical protein H6631_12050 [Anaerolineaceae bacterium]|nr:hypothetical protein [Anaerolineaceae bacterium]MCB9099865.1 hypothetical protein [Anaerolineales bacterium]